MKTFIRTSDSATAEKLISEGLTFVSKEGSYYTFINESNHKFSEEDLKKVHYTDKLFI